MNLPKIISYHITLPHLYSIVPLQVPSRVSSPIYGVSKKELSHNERFYEEYEYERRLKKRRAKLITATEEAFAHIKRMSTDQMKGIMIHHITVII